MENLVKRRTPVRAAFTKHYNSLLSCLKETNPDCDEIKIKVSSLERIAAELAALDEQIITALIDAKSESFDSEYESIEQYREKLDIARISSKTCIDKLSNICESPLSISGEKTKLKLPKIELLKFNGEVKDWLSFWSQFSRIHDDKSIDDEDKFQYLIQCMTFGSRAKQIVDSYPPTAENYSKAVDSLKTRFGREDLLIEYYVRELISLVVKNAMNAKSKVNIMQLSDKLESSLRSLESIGVSSDKYAAMLFPLVESCIPENLLRVWLRNPIVNTEEENPYGDKLSQLLLFLRTEVEGEERISLAKNGFKSNEVLNKAHSYKEEISVPTANDLLSGAKFTKRTCLFCGKSHYSQDCFKGQKMSFEEKKNILKKCKACFVCLRIGHRSSDCRANVRCIVCKKKHLAILCPELPDTEKRITSEVSHVEENVALSNHSQTEVLLQTLVVSIKVGGKKKDVRALIDTGSQRSYVLESTINQMGATSQRIENLTHVVFGGISSRKQHKCYTLSVSSLKKNYSCEIQVLDQKVICGYIPSVQQGPLVIELQNKGINLTDVRKDSLPVELLIGADYAGELYTGNVFTLPSGLAAVETKLGWVLMGKPNVHSNSNLLSTCLSVQNIHIADLWKLETIGIMEPSDIKNSKELEKEASDYFLETIKINEDERFEIRLPWMRNVEDLPTNRDIAAKRLITTSSKLLKNGQFENYDAVFENWLREGFIEESEEGPGHYLPHRGVFKPESTTPVRPVFDASCKKMGNLSLNDCLMKGPNLLQLIPSLLLKFREKEIGVISDIKKAFLQISVSKEDRKYLKFLWWKNKNREEVKIYQHARVVFGLNCSPYLLNAVIHHHLDRYISTSAEDSAMKLKNSFYVDNCVTSVDSKEELDRFVKDATELMAAAKFELRNWEFSGETNSTEKLKPSSVLGLMWNKTEDVLFCLPSLEKPSKITRRVILSFANRIFDPIGFTCPVTLVPKLILQDSWKSKLSWDSEVPEEVRKRFLKWLEDIQMLPLVKIPRKAFISNCRQTLHVFCDASGTSYAAVVFVRCQTDQETCVQLILAKSRVAPLKSITIPRLELLACCIGVRLSEFVKKSLNLENLETWFWTDSTTALQWICRDESWNVFVRNRVSEIRRFSNVENWRHVPGSLNIADLPSRGCSVLKLLNSRWWEGPPWLLLPENSWPTSNLVVDEEVVLRERAKKSIVLSNNSFEPNSSNSIFSYFSSYSKNVRMLAWMWRFYHNTRTQENNRKKGDLTLLEINEAENRIIIMIQSETLTEESIKGLKTLNCCRDEEGILRIKTKLTESNDLEDFRYPIVLSGKHKLVELLIREAHLRNLHAGVQILLSKLRERFWILNGRRTVRKEINKCLRCKRYSARKVETSPVGLPRDRVGESAAFEVTGVDLAGPLFLKGGEKSWIVLFTCATYRAIHLELVLSLSTKSFLLSLRRFIARRGRPKIMYSDNGKNFVGAENLLQNLDWSVIEQDSASQKITWKFIPPSAPWWGGFWERMVQLVKKLLRRVLGNACLFYEEMVSILCDCEAVINSRPLTYLSEDPNDLLPLTPSMFIQDIPTVGVPDLDQLDKTDVNKRWKHQQNLRECLRKRFRREYLGILVQARKKNNCYDVKPGDVVLIENDSTKRLFWPMAKIIEVYPGKDKIVRVVRLKTSTGEILRPVQRLYPLEIRSPTTVGSITEEGKADTNFTEIDSSNLKSVVTRSGRIVKLPSRWPDN